MKAVVMRAVGPPEVLRYEDVPTPEPGPAEVLVKVHAVSVNRTLDLAVRAGTYARKVPLPHVLGNDPTGVIAAVGAGVTSHKVGDHVACGFYGIGTAPRPLMPGIDSWGGYAEYIKIPADGAVPIPRELDFPTATVIARHAPMAFCQLKDYGKLKVGDWVLVMGAAGGLGNIAVQVAKLLGAKVIAAAGADERVKQGIAAGADAGINYRTQDLTGEARRITDGRGVDVVLENIGDPTTFPKAFRSLARGGRLVTAGAHGGGQVTIDVSFLYLNQITIAGGTLGQSAYYKDAMEAAAAGKLKANIECILPLSKAVDGHHLVGERKVTGKVLLDPTQG